VSCPTKPDRQFELTHISFFVGHDGAGHCRSVGRQEGDNTWQHYEDGVVTSVVVTVVENTLVEIKGGTLGTVFQLVYTRVMEPPADGSVSEKQRKNWEAMLRESHTIDCERYRVRKAAIRPALSSWLQVTTCNITIEFRDCPTVFILSGKSIVELQSASKASSGTALENQAGGEITEFLLGSTHNS
jgi:hypothetical protein